MLAENTRHPEINAECYMTEFLEKGFRRFNTPNELLTWIAIIQTMSDRSLRQTSDATGINCSTLSRFVRGIHGMSSRTLAKWLEYMGWEIVIKYNDRYAELHVDKAVHLLLSICDARGIKGMEVYDHLGIGSAAVCLAKGTRRSLSVDSWFGAFTKLGCFVYLKRSHHDYDKWVYPFGKIDYLDEAS